MKAATAAATAAGPQLIARDAPLTVTGVGALGSADDTGGGGGGGVTDTGGGAT
jgi:hypothetical protein